MTNNPEEQMFPIGEAIEIVTGVRRHKTTPLRWIHRSKKPLNAILLGGRWLCTLSDVRRFIAEGTDSATRRAPQPTRSPVKRTRQIARAAKTLGAMGV